MEDSPRGHCIAKISGEAAAIEARGRQMENLGMQMRESASILEKIKNGTEGQGFSVDKIKDSVGELHVDLGRAGERYEPSGRVIRVYGEALDSVQVPVNTIVDECERLWGLYVNASGAVDDAASASIPADETPEQKTERENAADELSGSKESAYQAWLEEATKYDDKYDTWDEAYETAVAGLQDVNEDGVTDSWWDDQLPWIEVVLQVLTVVGIILAVVCLFVAGPVLAVLAAIAAVLALVSLVFTIVKVANGRGNGWDIVGAVVGVIPFGRLGSLFKGGAKLGPFLTGMLGDMTGFSGVTQFRTLMDARGLPALINNFPPVNSVGNLVQSENIISSITGLGDEIADLSRFGVNPAGVLDNILGGTSGSFNANLVEAFSHYGTNVGNHIRTYFPASGGDLVPGGWEQVGNVIDMVVKPGDDLIGEIGSVISGQGPSDQDTWQQELANNS